MRCDKRKMRKIKSLKEVLSSRAHSLDKIFLSKRPVFYCRTTKRILLKTIANGLMLSAMEDLQVIDTISGARMKLVSGDTVFILILSHDSIQKLIHVKKTLSSLYALDKGKNKAERQGRT